VTEQQKEKLKWKPGIPKPSGSGRSKGPIILTGLLTLGLVLAYFIFPGFQFWVNKSWEVLISGDRERISAYVAQFGFWGPLFIVLAMVAQIFLLVVTVVALMLVAVIAYGPIWGTIISVVAVLVASSIAFFIGRLVGQAGVRKLIGEKAEKKVAAFMADYGLWAVVISRISPFISNDAVSFVAGFARMRYWTFIVATVAGILPLAILLAWLGQNYHRLRIGLVWITVVSLAFFVGYVLYDKYFKSKSPSN
jgi:uncharacterized membrane protein YdjX (TVP38/TMEM64 family)